MKVEVVKAGEFYGVRLTFGFWPFLHVKYVDMMNPRHKWDHTSEHFLRECWGDEKTARAIAAKYDPVVIIL